MVVSNGERVELFLNGRSLGPGRRSAGFLFTWPNVRWRPGVLRAVASDAAGRVSTHQIETAGAPAALRLKAITSPRGFVADGADIALVDTEVVDARGRRVPTARDKVHFRLEGPALWRGGIAQGSATPPDRARDAPTPGSTAAVPDQTTHFDTAAGGDDNYVLASDLPVEAGINRVLLRAGTRPGVVRLTATAPGLKSASVRLATFAPTPARSGLSLDFAERTQTGLLGRGPTPAPPSFRMTRSTYRPATVAAGSNAAEARNSIDDDELSRWVSDGAPANAWIEYRFDRPVILSELDLKLVGWRSRTYPLRVTLDGREIWRGETERSLGYAHVAFPPASGQTLRLTQVGPVADVDAFGKVVELSTARQAGDTGADQVAPGWRLAIVEADFHGPIDRAVQPRVK